MREINVPSEVVPQPDTRESSPPKYDLEAWHAGDAHVLEISAGVILPKPKATHKLHISSKQSLKYFQSVNAIHVPAKKNNYKIKTLSLYSNPVRLLELYIFLICLVLTPMTKEAEQHI